MTMTDRRGFTMVELMVALVLTLAVGGVTYGLLVNSQRVSRSQTEHVGMQDNVRSGALIVTNELREIGFDSIPGGAANTDLMVLEQGRIRYRAMRGIGFTCFPPAANELRIYAAPVMYLGLRQPQPNDGVTVYVEGDPTTDQDDAWMHANVTGVSAKQCTDGTNAIALAINYVAGDPTAQLVVGGPVRVYEVMEMRHYQSGTQWWLGMRSVTGGGAIQPVLGPLADSTAAQSGLVFTFFDKAHGQTAVLNSVREIQVTLKGVSDGAVRTGGGGGRLAVDTLALTTNVALRNTLRP